MFNKFNSSVIGLINVLFVYTYAVAWICSSFSNVKFFETATVNIVYYNNIVRCSWPVRINSKVLVPESVRIPDFDVSASSTTEIVTLADHIQLMLLRRGLAKYQSAILGLYFTVESLYLTCIFQHFEHIFISLLTVVKLTYDRNYISVVRLICMHDW